MYTPEMLNRFKSPKNAGELDVFNGKGEAGDSECSDVIEMKILFEEERIKDARFKVFGCPRAISTTDAFIDLIIGKTIGQALQITQEDISQMLGGLPLSHMHCSMLPIEAFRNALEDYEVGKK